jgi:peptide-methionine (S)-S-oxide reductase
MKKANIIIGLIALLPALGLALAWAKGGESMRSKPKSARGLFLTEGNANDSKRKTELAGFAAGCFWGVENEFRKLKGVVATSVGYCGGHTRNPDYHAVCEGDTGHAETVQVEYDPKIISYENLLETFWNLHDPTTPNRQGPDVGEQYRSAIFYYSEPQHQAALASRDRLQRSGELDAPIVTEISPAATFTPAEGYHQQYVEKGGAASCHYRRKKAAAPVPEKQGYAEYAPLFKK